MPIEQINGTTLFYEETGDGEPLVLVHGSWVDHSDWDPVLPGLANAFRVVTCDLRGHGKSRLDPPDAGTVHDDVADVAALIQHIELGPVNVAGISSGACIALRLAIEHPAMVLRVLPHEPPCVAYLFDDPENKPLLEDFGEAIAAVQRQLEAGDHRGAAQHFFDTVVRSPWSEMPRSRQDLIAAQAIPFLAQLGDPDAIALDPDELRSVSAPVLLSQGSASPALLILVVDQVAKLLSNALPVVVASAGHLPHQTHPDQYVAMVLEFIRST